MNEQKQNGPRSSDALRTVIIDAALSLSGEIGWTEITLQRIGTKTGLREQEVKAIFSSEWRILEAFRTRTDEQVAKRENPNWSDRAPRDRLFEVLMQRIEIIEPWKSGLASIASYGIKQPLAGIKLFMGLQNSMAKMLDYVEIRPAPPEKFWQSHGLTVIYLLALRRWFSDDSDDLGPTMAELNERLIAADRLMARICTSAK